jgi:hypothetical protein
MSNVRLKLPPKLIESARASQYANRERQGVRETEVKLKKRAKRQAEEEVKKKQLDKDKQPDGRRVGGQLEHEKREQYKIWTRRRKRGGVGYLLVPDTAPDEQYISLVTGDGFENSAYGNLGSVEATPEIDPGMTFEAATASKPARLIATKTRNIPGGAISGPETYGVFYHIADPSPPVKRQFPFPNPNPPHENSLYETCTFEVIISLGSTPAPSGTIQVATTKPGYSLTGNGYAGDSFPMTPETDGPVAYIDFFDPGEQPKPIPSLNDILDITEFGPSTNYNAELFLLLGGVQLEITFDSELSPLKWRLDVFNFDVAEEDKLLDGDRDYHFAIVYEKDKVTEENKVTLYLDGKAISTEAKEFTSTRNLTLARSKVSALAYKAGSQQVLPYNPFTQDRRPIPVYWIRAGFNTPGTSNYRPPELFLIGSLTLDDIQAKAETTECQCGFRGLRFTPEQALYGTEPQDATTGKFFIPPTTITDLAD